MNFQTATMLLALSTAEGLKQIAYPLQDATIFDGENDSARGVGDNIVGMTASGARRALIQFDISRIPADAVVKDVVLDLDVKHSAGEPKLNLFRVTSPWSAGSAEGEGIDGTMAESEDSTWRYSTYTSIPWKTAGGDYDAQVLSSENMSFFWSTPELIKTVEDMIQGNIPNYGFLLVGPEEGEVSYQTFGSMEGPTSEKPKLVVEYESNEAPIRTALRKRSLEGDGGGDGLGGSGDGEEGDDGDGGDGDGGCTDGAGGDDGGGDDGDGGDGSGGTEDGDDGAGGDTEGGTADGDDGAGGDALGGTADGDDGAGGDALGGTADGDDGAGGDALGGTADGDDGAGGDALGGTADGDDGEGGDALGGSEVVGGDSKKRLLQNGDDGEGGDNIGGDGDDGEGGDNIGGDGDDGDGGDNIGGDGDDGNGGDGCGGYSITNLSRNSGAEDVRLVVSLIACTSLTAFLMITL